MKQHQRPLAVGDFCTTKSRYPENQGLRVVVVAHEPGRRVHGRVVPYSIQRIDGKPMPFTTGEDGVRRRNAAVVGYITRGRLVRIDLDGEDRHDVLAIGVDIATLVQKSPDHWVEVAARQAEKERRAKVAAKEAIEKALSALGWLQVTDEQLDHLGRQR